LDRARAQEIFSKKRYDFTFYFRFLFCNFDRLAIAEELSIQSPLNLIRLFADNSLGDLVPILPQHKLASNPHLHNGAFIHISLLTTPTPSPATSMTMSNVSYGTSSIDSLRAEIEKLKLDIARLMSSSSPVSGTGMRPALLKPVVAAPKQVVDTSGRDIAVNPAKVSVALASSDAAAIMARLDDLDTKLEYKNCTDSYQSCGLTLWMANDLKYSVLRSGTEGSSPVVCHDSR
jgi:hypothetical protein